MNRKKVLQLFLCMIGIIFSIAGLMQGEFSQTWNKAIRVCLECIGIG